MLRKDSRPHALNTQHLSARCVRRSLIKTRDVATDHQPDHVAATILLAQQHSCALAVAKDDDAISQLLDFAKPMRDVEDADAARSQVTNNGVEIGHFVLGKRRGWLVHD